MANNIAYNGSDKWKIKATELLNQGGGGGGLVDDVKVNGTSVVDANKVAQIDLTPYTKTEDLATVATSGKTSDLINDSNFVADASYVHTDNNFTTSEKTKLSGIASGAEVNVQSDWSQSDNTADDYIKNKPNTTYTGNGNIAVTNNVVTRKEVWLTMAEYTALQNPDADTDYHITDGTYPVADQLPITVVNGKLCYHFRREVT